MILQTLDKIYPEIQLNTFSEHPLRVSGNVIQNKKKRSRQLQQHHRQFRKHVSKHMMGIQGYVPKYAMSIQEYVQDSSKHL